MDIRLKVRGTDGVELDVEAYLLCLLEEAYDVAMDMGDGRVAFKIVQLIEVADLLPSHAPQRVSGSAEHFGAVTKDAHPHALRNELDLAAKQKMLSLVQKILYSTNEADGE